MNEHTHDRLPREVRAACASRLQRLRHTFDSDGIEALLVSFDRDIQYLTDFVGDDTYLLVRADAADIITDSRYETELEAWKGSGIGEPVMGVRHRLPETIESLCRAHRIGRLGIQAEHLTIAAGHSLRTALCGIQVVETTGLVGGLRIHKDALEVSLIERASRIQEQALRRALARLHLGMTENEFFAELAYEMKRLGAMGASFDSIIAAGPGSALPHYSAGDVPIEEGVLLIDWGARYRWYCADLTRTFGVISMPRAIREVYPIVLEAQLAAIEAIGPGRVCAEIDAVARKVIVDAGHGEHFTHGLGHGLGNEVHEAPYFNDLQTDVVLTPGMVMTVEPGIYLPGVGGVRIEDDVLITDDGCRVLSDYPKDLDSAVIEPADSGALA
jgi:Xaa-Pro aminopeptidase